MKVTVLGARLKSCLRKCVSLEEQRLHQIGLHNNRVMLSTACSTLIRQCYIVPSKLTHYVVPSPPNCLLQLLLGDLLNRRRFMLRLDGKNATLAYWPDHSSSPFSTVKLMTALLR